MHFCLTDCDKNSIILQKGETVAFRWLTRDEILEMSDDALAPTKALEILKAKRNGTYNVVQIDPNYIPEEKETKQVFGITFEQGRNNFKIDRELVTKEIVTKNKNLPESAIQDMIISLITLKYTQSNSVCFAHNGQAIGVGAGQQSRIHCTRLAAQKADLWHLRQHEKVLNLQFADGVGRPDKNNIIDLYLSDRDSDTVLGDDVWQKYFAVRPEPFTREEIQTLAEKALKVIPEKVEKYAKVINLNKVDFLCCDALIFTNFSQDHLDFFKTMENYKNTKFSFFNSKNLQLHTVFFTFFSKKLKRPLKAISFEGRSPLFIKLF